MRKMQRNGICRDFDGPVVEERLVTSDVEVGIMWLMKHRVSRGLNSAKDAPCFCEEVR